MRKIIDFHAHAFADKIAEKATVNLGEFYSLPVSNIGTAEALAASSKEANVKKVVVCTTATSPHQVEHINNFMKSLESDLFLPLGAMHPNYSYVEKEIDRIYAMGLHGLKMHPDFQEFDANSPKAIRIYKALEKVHLPLLIHSGDPHKTFSLPHKIADIKQHCPDLIIIAAHLGGYRRLEEADKYLIGKDFYIDTSSSLWYINTEDAKSIILKHGTNKVLFGTDFPLSDHKNELSRFDSLRLPDKDSASILYYNAKRLLRI